MYHSELMKGFPPAADTQVSLANWRKPPFNRWSFAHVREIVPSADIPNVPEAVRPLPQSVNSLDGLAFRFEDEELTFNQFLNETYTDGLVVMREGSIVHEIYGPHMDATTPHILMSVSKSILGLLAGTLAEQGTIAVDRRVTDWVPEVRGSAYEGASLRDLLDMRVGVKFEENYQATGGAIIAYRKAQNWDPLDPGEMPSDLRSFFASLSERDGHHSANFHYVSPNTDLLGWVIERATGRRYADLVSELLWRPMGAERPAYITVDRLGAPRCAGGFCCTTRDLARLGQLLIEGGRGGERQIVPATWIDDILANGNGEAWRAGDFIPYFGDMPIRYRSKWYVLDGDQPLLFGVGVHGQNLFVDRDRHVVIAKLSSQPAALDRRMIMMTMAAVEALRTYTS